MNCHCGNPGRLFGVAGFRCPAHQPAQQAAIDATRYCASRRCYCGECPWWTPYTLYVDNPERIAVDARAIASGRRRSSLHAYRAAQETVRKTKSPARGGAAPSVSS